jgi:hypothetical protein
MSPEPLFRIHLVLGYVAWLLCFLVYIWPRLTAMDRDKAHRAIATLHSFRFFGLVFILPGVVGPNRLGLPAVAGELGAAYAIPILYVPLLMITHVAAFYLLVRPHPRAAWGPGTPAAA